MRITLLALLLTAAAVCTAQSPWEPADLWNWRTASEARIRSDGQWVAYAEGWSDRAADASYSNLWAVSTDQKLRIRLTDGAWRDTSPRWSPDGSRIAWLRQRSGNTELHTARFDSRAEWTVAAGAIENFAWSPDGQSIAFTRSVDGSPGAPWWAPDTLPLPVPPPPERLGWFIVASDGGNPRRIPAGDIEAAGEPAWMPDGQSMASAAADGQIYSIRITDGAARRLTSGARLNQNPVVSPNGAHIAFLSTDSTPRSYAIRKLMTMSPDGTGVKVLAGALDRDAADPQWSSDSRTVYFLADDHGLTHVYAGRADGSTRQATSAPERLSGFTLADNGRAASVRATALRAEEVVTFAVDQEPAPVLLAAPNEALIAARRTAGAEEIAVPSAGKTIQGWVVKPPGFDASKQYPLLLDIADSPRRMCGVEFSPEAQIYAARGYVVLLLNPRGTPGYGEEFGTLLFTRYPGDDADDLLRGVEFVLGRGSIDARRIAVKGGLLAAWLIGHTTRFRAAVTRHALVDWTLDVATSPDGLRHAVNWLNALPWEDPEQYARRSPISYASSFQTPTLVIAADPDPQSDELYFALRQRQVESQLARIADDGRPGALPLELEAALAWLDRTTGAPSASPRH